MEVGAPKTVRSRGDDIKETVLGTQEGSCTSSSQLKSHHGGGGGGWVGMKSHH